MDGLGDVSREALALNLLAADMLTRQKSGILSVRGEGWRVPRLKDLKKTKKALDAAFEALTRRNHG